MKRYTRSGREISLNGKPFVFLQRMELQPGPDNGYATGSYAYSPAEADDLAIKIVKLLNEDERATTNLRSTFGKPMRGNVMPDTASSLKHFARHAGYSIDYIDILEAMAREMEKRGFSIVQTVDPRETQHGKELLGGNKA